MRKVRVIRRRQCAAYTGIYANERVTHVSNDNAAGFSGSLLGGEPLRRALGFTSGEAFRAAVRTGRIPVRLFKVERRKGWFAQAEEVTSYLRTVAGSASPP